jgi:hypothetical protein
MSILKPWTERLGLRHQGVLMSVIRGCDNAPKEDPAKALARSIRYVLLHSFSDKPSSFIENVDEEELKRRMVAVLSSHDQYPVHYIMHLLHATEIIGYKHPDRDVAARWEWFYRNLAKCFHLNPETEEQLDERLGACEDQFANNARIDNRE